MTETSQLQIPLQVSVATCAGGITMAVACPIMTFQFIIPEASISNIEQAIVDAKSKIPRIVVP